MIIIAEKEKNKKRKREIDMEQIWNLAPASEAGFAYLKENIFFYLRKRRRRRKVLESES